MTTSTTVSAESGDTVTFKLINTAILQTDFTNCKVLGTLSYEGARGLDPELVSKHYNLFPYFSSAVNNVNDPSAYLYLIVTPLNGVTQAVGIPWISAATFEVISNQTLTVTINNYVQSRMLTAIQDLMGNLGASATYTITNNAQSSTSSSSS